MYYIFLKKNNVLDMSILKNAKSVFIISYIGSFLYLFLGTYLSYPLEFIKGNYDIVTPVEWLIIIALSLLVALIVPITIDIIKIQNWKKDNL